MQGKSVLKHTFYVILKLYYGGAWNYYHFFFKNHVLV